MQSNAGSGHLAHGAQGGHLGESLGLFPDVDVEEPELVVELEPDVEELAAEPVMQTGQTGGTICDFKIYKSSWPVGIWLWGTPGGSVL